MHSRKLSFPPVQLSSLQPAASIRPPLVCYRAYVRALTATHTIDRYLLSSVLTVEVYLERPIKYDRA